MADHFFFYGTLIPEFAPPKLREVLAKLQLVGEGSARGVLYDLGPYPGAIFDEASTSRVHGRVFCAHSEESPIALLDMYEMYDPSGSQESNEYLRKRLSVTLETGKQINCWAYEYNRSRAVASIIPSGRYIPRRSDN